MKNIFEKLKIYGPKTFFSFAISELRNRLLMQLIKGSYSQKGEDLIMDKFLKNKKRGFYVDIGAYDPKRFSNTYRFYQKGWLGINIEPDTLNYEKFLAERKRDINLNIGVGNSKKSLLFYKFVPDTLSTFSQKEAEEYKKQGYKLVDTIKVRIESLSGIFSKYCKNKKIDFISVDTEGYDLEVLKSNNWDKFRPTLICVESFEHHKSGGEHTEYNYIEPFLSKVGYRKIFENGLNCIYTFKSV